MAQGKLIVLDGTDGSGKHTQTMLLKENLEKLGYKIETIDFPQYGKKSAGPVEDLLNGVYGTSNAVDAYQASILFAVDRFDASFKIRKWLNEGKIVLCDRYTSANMGHQAGKILDLKKRDEFLEWIDNLEFEIFKIPRPDVNLFLYMDPEVSRNLALKVTKKNMDKKKDIYENDSKHMKQASLAFQYVAKKYNWSQISCCREDNSVKTREEISKDVLSQVREKLEL